MLNVTQLVHNLYLNFLFGQLQVFSITLAWVQLNSLFVAVSRAQMVTQIDVRKAHSTVSFTVVGIMLDGNLAVFQCGLIVFQFAMCRSSTRKQYLALYCKQ